HQTRRNISHVGVRYDGDFLDVHVMISNEAKVVDHRRKAVPGEPRCLDDETSKTAGRLDVRVDRLGNVDKVVPLDGRFHLHVQDGMLGIEVVFDHVSLRDESRLAQDGWVFRPLTLSAFVRLLWSQKAPKTSVEEMSSNGRGSTRAVVPGRVGPSQPNLIAFPINWSVITPRRCCLTSCRRPAPPR